MSAKVVMPFTQRIRKLSLKCSLSLGSTLVVLIAAELVCRLIFPSWAPVSGDRLLWVYDPDLGWFHRPNSTGTFRHPEFSIKVSTNSQGLRDDDYPLERVPGKKRVLILGDSFGWGYGVEKNQRFSERIERRRPQWEVINASVSGYGTDQEYVYLTSRGLNYHPDAVVLLFYGNDFENNSNTVQYWHSKPKFVVDDGPLTLTNTPVPRPTITQRAGKFILGRTYLYARLYRSLRGRKETDTNSTARPQLDNGVMSPSAAENEDMSQTNGTKAVAAKDIRPGKGSTDSSVAGMDITVAILEKMATDLKKANIKFAVVTIPMAAGTQKKFNQALEELQIRHLDLTRAFESPEKSATIPGDCHWTAYGHSLAAQAIEPFIADLLKSADK